MSLDQNLSFGSGFRDFSNFWVLICFHSFCLVFTIDCRWDFTIELRVGLDQTSFFLLFFQKNQLVGLLLWIDLYQF